MTLYYCYYSTSTDFGEGKHVARTNLTATIVTIIGISTASRTTFHTEHV